MRVGAGTRGSVMDSRLRGNDGESSILIFILIRDSCGGITNKTAWAEAHPTFWRDTI